MECMFEAYLTHEGLLEPDDIPQTKEPVWILGKRYNGSDEIELIRRDILSKIWCTYRKGFAPIGGADGFTSDKGWGCMLRCGQMLLAQALMRVHLGRDWIWESDTMDPTYLKIIRKFEDQKSCPYSIHQIAVTGQAEGKSIGQWFGPNTISQVLKKLVVYDEWQSLVIHVAMDNVIVIEDIMSLCLPEGSTTWKPLLLIIPVRLGVSSVNSIYIGSLKKSFTYKQSLGVIGGKPNLALYFMGYVEDEFIYLDPHTTQKFDLIGEKKSEEQKEADKTYHCRHAQRMNLVNMDPSLAVSFLCKTQEEFHELCDQINGELNDPVNPPIFYVHQKRTEEWTSNLADLESCEEAIGATSLVGLSDAESDNSIAVDLEEFEFL